MGDTGSAFGWFDCKDDGSSIISENELSELGVLKLIDCIVLNDSYIRVRYQVIN